MWELVELAVNVLVTASKKIAAISKAQNEGRTRREEQRHYGGNTVSCTAT
jgi:hypothetical protein